MAVMSRESAPHLNLWKQQLGCVPESVWEQTELETLVLAENGLEEVSAQIGRLQKLRMLDVGHNKLTWVRDALGELTGLTDFLYLLQLLGVAPFVFQAPDEASLLKFELETNVCGRLSSTANRAECFAIK